MIRLSDGKLVGRQRANLGRTITLGPSARLRIGGEGGIEVVVISIRQQMTDPAILVPPDPGRSRTTTVCTAAP